MITQPQNINICLYIYIFVNFSKIAKKNKNNFNVYLQLLII